MPQTLAGVCIRYTRVRTPVAVKGEWRPNERQELFSPQDNGMFTKWS
jgi:hypothetical protein